MKKIKLIACILGMAVLPLTMIQAQTNKTEQITIPLSNPGKAGSLTVNLINGTVSVRGYNGKEVVVGYTSSDRSTRRDVDVNAEGLRRIPSNNPSLEIREDNNTVKVETGLTGNPLHLDIQVPRNFSLKLSTVNGGGITVEDVEGEFELSNVNGPITLKDVSGSVVANTVNGAVVANLRKVTPDAPMAFSSLNGKIDVTFPASTKMLAKMKTDQGEIFTDFDMAFEQPSSDALKPTKFSGGGSKVHLDNWTYGKVNGGGPEVLFKNFNGNIYIRKR